MRFDLFQQLLQDATYKKATKDLDDEQREHLEEYMKDFMAKMEEGILSPFGVVASNEQAKKEFQKLWKQKHGKETLASRMNGKK